MTFEYRDHDGDSLLVLSWAAGGPGPIVSLIVARADGRSNGVFIPVDRVEEVIAGIRDTARTASGQQAASARPTERRPSRAMSAEGPEVVVATDTDRLILRQVGWLGQTGAFYDLDEKPLGDGHERGGVAPLYFPAHSDRLDDLMPDPTIADDPTPLRWGLGDVLHSDDDTVIVCLSGPDRAPYWLELDADRAAALRDDLTTPTEMADRRIPTCYVQFMGGAHCATAPAVGQPAEAQATDRAALRERIRLAVAQWHIDNSGSGRTIRDLDDTEFSTAADAVLSVLTVEDER